MRRIATALTTLTFSLSGLVCGPAQAAVPVDGTYSCATGEIDGGSGEGYYTITNGVVQGGDQSAGGNCAGAVVIPEGVTSIGLDAFLGASELTSINIPASVTAIGQSAFSGNFALKSINIPANVTSIGQEAFLSAYALQFAIFESGSQLTSIGDDAFKDTTALMSISIPASVTSIGDGAFFGSLGLIDVRFEGSAAPAIGTDAFTQVGSSPKAYIKTSTSGYGTPGSTWNGLFVVALDNPGPQSGLYDCATGQLATEGSRYTIKHMIVANESGRSCNGAVVITSGVTEIGSRAFRARTPNRVTSVNLPASMTKIGDEAFYNSGLTSISIPASVTTIGTSAFENSLGTSLTTVTFAPGSQLTSIGSNAFLLADKLASITIPGSVTSIGSGAFQHTRALTSITIPASVTSIGANAFFDSQGLATVTFESGSQLASIGAGAFMETTALTSISIPASVTTIGDGAFSTAVYFSPPGVKSLTAITVDPANLSYTSIDGVLFNKDATTLIQYPSNKSNSAYSIPAGVTSIGNSAFGRATNLTSVTMPASVTSIGDMAFRQTTALSSVSIPAGVTAIGSDAFNGASTLASVSFLGSAAPTVGSRAFTQIAGSAKAYIRPGATGFNATGSPARWNGLDVSLLYEGVSFNTNGGTAVATQDYVDNITEPTVPTKAGYDFVGWTATDGGETTVTFPYAPSQTSVTLYAKWTPTSYAVTYDAKGGSAVTNGSFFTGGSIDSVPTVPTRAGYSFAGWAATDGDQSTVTFPYAPGVTEDITLYAKWIGNTNTVTYDSQGGTAVLDGSFVTGGSIGSAPAAPTKAGYGFVGWTTTDGGETTVTFPYTPSELSGITLYAKWSANTNTVTYDSQGGTAVLDGSFITGGSIAFAPATPTRAGYSFAGWTATDGGEVTVTFPYAPSVTEGITLYAKWTVNTYVVTYDSQGGTTVVDGSFVTGGSIELAPTAPTRAGYSFGGWSSTDGGAIVGFPYAPSVAEDITLYAKWTVNTYVVTYDSQGGTTVVDGSFVTGGSIELAPAVPTRAGYSFAGWTATNGGEVTVTFPYAPSETSGITLYAKWTVNTYAVTYDSQGGTVVVDGSFVTGGSIGSAPTAPTRAGYGFIGWSSTDGGAIVGFPYSPTATSDITLYAKWSANTNTVTYDSQGGTAVGSGSFITGGSIGSSPAVPTRADYSFVGWTATDGGETIVTFPYTPSETSDITLYAKWLSVPRYEPILSGSPVISGNARQKTYLESTSGTWSAHPAAVTTLQWYRCDKKVYAGQATLTAAMNCAKITGATRSKYKVVLADQGKYLTVLIEAKNEMGSTFSTAKSVRAPKAIKPVLKSAPRISGSVVKGKVVTLAAGTWYANPTPITTQQWYRCENPVSLGLSEFTTSQDCVKIPGATKAKYTIAVADQAKYLTALVTSRNSQGVVVKSAKSVRVPGTQPALRTSPQVSGSATVGNTLRAFAGTWTAIPVATTSLAWYRCSTAVAAGATSITSSMRCTKISGATGSTYTVKPADQGKYLTALVTAQNSEGIVSSTAKSIYVRVPVVTP